MSDTLKFKAGSAITFTTGEYSDFGTCGTLIMLKDVDLAERARSFDAASKAANPKAVEDGWYGVDLYAFSAFLITSGYAMAADVQEVHLGNYSKFEPEFLVEN